MSRSPANITTTSGATPTPETPPKPRITTEGSVYVTLRAVIEYATSRGTAPSEDLRRELTEIMCTGYRVASGHVRARSRARGVDVTATAIVDGPLVLITTVHVRRFAKSEGAANRERRIAGRSGKIK